MDIEALDPNFRITLPAFEGPLDLLLHLIQKHELDVLDLPIAFVTDAYLQYLGLMQQLNLDVASEYLLMAATLAHIKSKMLLPSPPVDQDEDSLDEEQLDPRAQLIRRLLEYQKYKQAAEQLGSRGIEGRDTFLRGAPPPEASGPAPLADISLFSLLDAFQAVLKRAKSELAFEVTAERISIQDRITQITERLSRQTACTFEELFDEKASVPDLVVTFLAVLEMAKMRLAQIYQPDATSTIHLRLNVTRIDEGTAEELPEA